MVYRSSSSQQPSSFLSHNISSFTTSCTPFSMLSCCYINSAFVDVKLNNSNLKSCINLLFLHVNHQSIRLLFFIIDLVIPMLTFFSILSNISILIILLLIKFNKHFNILVKHVKWVKFIDSIFLPLQLKPLKYLKLFTQTYEVLLL